MCEIIGTGQRNIITGMRGHYQPMKQQYILYICIICQIPLQDKYNNGKIQGLGIILLGGGGGVTIIYYYGCKVISKKIIRDNRKMYTTKQNWGESTYEIFGPPPLLTT